MFLPKKCSPPETQSRHGRKHSRSPRRRGGEKVGVRGCLSCIPLSRCVIVCVFAQLKSARAKIFDMPKTFFASSPSPEEFQRQLNEFLRQNLSNVSATPLPQSD